MKKLYYTVQIANALGYKVIEVDRGPERLEFFKRWAANHAIEANKVSKFVAKSYGGGLLNSINVSIMFS